MESIVSRFCGGGDGDFFFCFAFGTLPRDFAGGVLRECSIGCDLAPGSVTQGMWKRSEGENTRVEKTKFRVACRHVYTAQRRTTKELIPAVVRSTPQD